MKGVPEVAGGEELRARALLRLLPLQVHALRNALVVVQGAHELVHRSEVHESARDKLRVLSEGLERLARFARPPSTHAEPRELGELFRGLEVLLRPLERGGAELDLRRPTPAIVRCDAGLEALLVALCVAWLEPGSGRRGVRILARSVPRGLHLVLHARDGHSAPAETEALLAHARAQGWSSVARRAPGRVSLRLRLPLLPAGSATRAPKGGPRRVLLLHRERAEREFAGEVLAEQGHRVHVASAPPLDGLDGPEGGSDEPFDLALVERELLEHDPHLASRLLARLGLQRVEPLDSRMRPEELLALVTPRG